MNNVLAVTNVSYRYPHQQRLAVDDVTASVSAGAIVGLLGPNGSGKTTLLRLFAGMLAPLGGDVLLNGRPVRSIPRRELARELAVVPQETHSTFDFTALEIVLMGRYAHLGRFELEGAGDLAIARDALRATGTEALDARTFGTLSGGEKQRVAIASALAQASSVLLLDEPTASLDLGFQLEIAALLVQLNRARGVTMIVSTHDLNLAAAICTELVLLSGGRLVAHGETSAVLTAAHVRALYGVDAEVSTHPKTGRLMVVPIGNSRRS